MRVKFTVLGEPVGKGRPRFSNAGPYVKTYTPEKTANYETLVKLEYERQCGDYRFPDSAQLDVRIIAFYEIPKSTSKKKTKMMENGMIRPTKTPDFDNIGKIVCDSLNKIAYRDDSQIVDAQVRKFYSRNPRVVITIQEAQI